jgi:hypothetical protein
MKTLHLMALFLFVHVGVGVAIAGQLHRLNSCFVVEVLSDI